MKSSNTVILANVTINADRKYSQSYGAPVDAHYAFAKVTGNWITTYTETGYCLGKSMINAKHFHSYDGTEITERTFNMRTKKAKALQDAQRAEKEALELAKHEAYITYCTELLEYMPTRIASVSEKINEILTIETINARFAGDVSVNELCNRAVGVVGYGYAQHLGWFTVLTAIKRYAFVI